MASSSARADSRGTDFWVAFLSNFDNGVENPQELTLFISAETAASGTVSIPGLGFSQNFTVTAGGLTPVIVPNGAVAGTDGGVISTEQLGIHVTANAEVTVYGFNDIVETTDGFLGLPVDTLGTQYRVMAYADRTFSELGVVATSNATIVTVVPSAELGDGTDAGIPVVRTLNAGEVLVLPSAANGDLTGSFVSSSSPVAVFGGASCALVPTNGFACNHLTEQMPPISAWGSDFITVPLASRSGGDRIRVLANSANTTVSINGTTVATLGAGQFHEQIVGSVSHITSSQPVLLAYFSQGASADLGTGDPSMMIIPPTSQFMTAYTFNSSDSFTVNFVNVVVPTASIGSLTLDGAAVNPGSFTAVSGTSFSVAQLSLTQGTHRLVASSGFGAYVYGFATANSYGFAAGMGVPTVDGGTGGGGGADGGTDAGTGGGGGADAGSDAGTGGGGGADAGTDAGTGGGGGADGGTDAGTGGGGGADAGTGSDAGTGNLPPVVCAGDDATGVEGSAVSLSGAASDTDVLMTLWTATPGAGVDPGASCVFANASALSTTVTCDDDGTWTITLTASDGVNPPVSDSLTLTVSNADPTVNITFPAEGARVQRNVSVSLLATVQDPGTNDTLTCGIDWGDGTSSTGTLSNGVCSGQHSYTAVGPYVLTVRATDDDGGAGSDSVNLLVEDVVTRHTIMGIGTIEPGDARLNHDRKDRVGFRFFITNERTLRGNLFVDAGSNRFRSLTLTSLSVSGSQATLTGTGSWNGVTGYTFTMVIDDDRSPGQRGRDRFSITIRDPSGATVLDGAAPLKSGFVRVR